MAITYVLIFVLLLHIYLFRKLIFKWNVFSVFFISTLIFSITGILLFPILKPFILKSFWTFNIKVITDAQVLKTQLIALSGLLLVLYSYTFILMLFYGKIKCMNHLKIEGELKDNISRSNYYFILLVIAVFLTIYLIIKRQVLITGFFDGLIGRDPKVLLSSRRGITSNYIYVIITYNILPFLAVLSLYLSLKRNNLFHRLIFFALFFTSCILILLLFQKRPLILFLLSFFLAGFIFKKSLKRNKVRIRKQKTKKQVRRKFIFYGLLLFSLLMLLYYSGTNYEFKSVFEGVSKLTEVALARIFGRLSLPSFFYVHYFPEVENHYGIKNIGMLSKLFRYDVYLDSKILFNYFSKGRKGGSLAISSIMDFYGAFGYYGIVLGSLFLGVFISFLDMFLNRLEKNAINIVFIIFCFVFAYYLSQASFARSLMGYGFIFFILIWIYLQKGLKIKLR